MFCWPFLSAGRGEKEGTGDALGSGNAWPRLPGTFSRKAPGNHRAAALKLVCGDKRGLMSVRGTLETAGAPAPSASAPPPLRPLPSAQPLLTTCGSAKQPGTCSPAPARPRELQPLPGLPLRAPQRPGPGRSAVPSGPSCNVVFKAPHCGCSISL